MKPKPPSFVIIIISTMITIFVWISFEIYRTLTSNPTVDVSPEVLEPLSPKLDTDALNRINSSFYLSNDELNQIIPSSTVTPPTPTTTPTEIKVATEEGEVLATPTPTGTI